MATSIIDYNNITRVIVIVNCISISIVAKISVITVIIISRPFAESNDITGMNHIIVVTTISLVFSYFHNLLYLLI